MSIINNPASNTQLRIDSMKDLSDVVSRMFLDSPSKIKPQARQLFNLESVPNNTGSSRLLEEYDSQTFAKNKPEGVDAKKAKAGTGYTKMAFLKRYGIEIDITWEMRKTGKLNQIKRSLVDLTNFCVHRQELDLSHRFAFANATSMVNMDGDVVDLTVGDGKALIDSAHTLAFSALTYSNQVSGNPVFSQSALEQAETMGTSDILSNFGEKRVMNFDTIVTSDYPSVVNAVKTLMQATAGVSAPNEGVPNVYEAKYKHVVLPYLATTATGARDANKKNYWFLLASQEWSGYVVEWETENLVTPTAGNNLEDGHADVWTYGVRGSWDTVIVSGRGVIGSLNAS